MLIVHVSVERLIAEAAVQRRSCSCPFQVTVRIKAMSFAQNSNSIVAKKKLELDRIQHRLTIIDD